MPDVRWPWRCFKKPVKLREWVTKTNLVWGRLSLVPGVGVRRICPWYSAGESEPQTPLQQQQRYRTVFTVVVGAAQTKCLNPSIALMTFLLLVIVLYVNGSLTRKLFVFNEIWEYINTIIYISNISTNIWDVSRVTDHNTGHGYKILVRGHPDNCSYKMKNKKAHHQHIRGQMLYHRLLLQSKVNTNTTLVTNSLVWLDQLL